MTTDQCKYISLAIASNLVLTALGRRLPHSKSPAFGQILLVVILRQVVRPSRCQLSDNLLPAQPKGPAGKLLIHVLHCLALRTDFEHSFYSSWEFPLVAHLFCSLLLLLRVVVDGASILRAAIATLLMGQKLSRQS